MSEWIQVAQGDHKATKPEKWQFEHWDTLFYCEKRASEKSGYIEGVWAELRLDLFLDLQGAGLVLFEADEGGHMVTLTDKGWKWAQFLRQWKAANGTLARVTLDHILGTDAEAMKRIGDLLLLSDMSIDTAMYTYGVNTITGDEFRDKIYEHCGIKLCSDCGTWVDSGSVNSEDQCEDCAFMYGDDMDEDCYEDDDWGDDTKC